MKVKSEIITREYNHNGANFCSRYVPIETNEWIGIQLPNKEDFFSHGYSVIHIATGCKIEGNFLTKKEAKEFAQAIDRLKLPCAFWRTDSLQKIKKSEKIIGSKKYKLLKDLCNRKRR